MWTQSLLNEDFLVIFLINIVQVLTDVCFFLSLLFFISVTLLVLSGDIETDPGPDLGYSSSFSFFHWNLNRIAAHKFIKIALINAISIAGLQASLYKVLILFLNQKPI